MRWFILVLAAALLAIPSFAADSNSSAAERKVVHKVVPAYPELARRLQIAGVVKLEALVAPNGTVKSLQAIGGSPVLIPAAEDAVKQWKYAPAPAQSRELIELRFSGH